LALVFNHRLNDRRHRGLATPPTRQNNRICASTTLDGSPPIAAPNQRKETTVKRSGKISVTGAVIVVTWGFLLRVASVCAGWREDAIRGAREGIAELGAAA